MSNAKPQHQPDDAFIVIAHDDKGKLAASPNPFTHPLEAGSIAEAERLAAANPGRRFSIFACIGVAVVEKPRTFRPTRWRTSQEIPF
jgi:hypothetical protein